MMSAMIGEIRPKMIPMLDPDFIPAVLENKAFSDAVEKSGQGTPVMIGLERDQHQVRVLNTEVFPEGQDRDECNFSHIERLIKTLLWIHGGWKISFFGPRKLFQQIKQAYSPGGSREFDAEFMSRVYEKEFVVEWIGEESQFPKAFEKTETLGGALDGYRIGFDAGGSDRKVAALDDGKVVFSEEVIWHPKTQSDPDYHYREIRAAIEKAAGFLPRVDGIGVSSAGIYVNNRTMVASLFNKVPRDLFDEKIKDIYGRIASDLGDIPIQVRNDGDVTALAGAMSLEDNKILGIAMGTSEAAGYIDGVGNITGWLNELAFVPVDLNTGAAVDEWSGDYGCGVKYFSQDGVIRLAPKAGIELDQNLTPAEKLKAVQELMKNLDPRAKKIYETLGCYLGYSLAHYASFYSLKHVLILGRVTSGAGGEIILNVAREVLKNEFPELANGITLHLPDENDRRVGQAIAAASLPALRLEKGSSK